jgi:hypothetical protein
MKTSEEIVIEERIEKNGVKGAGLSAEDAAKARDFVKNNTGNSKAFAESDIKKFFVEIEGSASIREAMQQIAFKDNGAQSPTVPENNQEFQGKVVDNRVIELESGKVVKLGPTNTGPIEAKYVEDTRARTRFHTHPSGVYKDGSGAYFMHVQHPSSVDISNTPEGQTRYVFARRYKTVYIYNSKGVQAEIPDEKFVKYK